MVCDACGAEMQIGDYPFCPHGRTSLNVVPDDIPGGMWQENGFSHPVKVYSWSELKRRLDAEGMQMAPRYIEGNKVGMTKWVSVDLEGATALVSRGAAPRHRGDVGPGGQPLLPPTSALPNEITVSDAGWSIGVRAE